MIPGKARVPSLVALDVVLKGLLCSLAFVVEPTSGFYFQFKISILNMNLHVDLFSAP